MGAGKTTIGRQLAKKISYSFYDSDLEIEQRTEVKISLIFEIEGEEGFRKRESDVISELVMLDNIVLSTGGGAVKNPENRKALIDNGFIIYLKSSPEKLFSRTSDNKRRPLLQGDDQLATIKGILAEREPIYLSLANEIISTEETSIKQIVQKILKLIETHESNRS